MRAAARPAPCLSPQRAFVALRSKIDLMSYSQAHVRRHRRRFLNVFPQMVNSINFGASIMLTPCRSRRSHLERVDLDAANCRAIAPAVQWVNRHNRRFSGTQHRSWPKPAIISPSLNLAVQRYHHLCQRNSSGRCRHADVSRRRGYQPATC